MGDSTDDEDHTLLEVSAHCRRRLCLAAAALGSEHATAPRGSQKGLHCVARGPLPVWPHLWPARACSPGDGGGSMRKPLRRRLPAWVRCRRPLLRGQAVRVLRHHVAWALIPNARACMPPQNFKP